MKLPQGVLEIRSARAESERPIVARKPEGIPSQSFSSVSRPFSGRPESGNRKIYRFA